MFASTRARNLRSEIDHAIEREVQINDLVGRDRLRRSKGVAVAASCRVRRSSPRTFFAPARSGYVEVRMNTDGCAEKEEDEDQRRHGKSMARSRSADTRQSARTT